MARSLLVLALCLTPILAFAQPPPKERTPRPALEKTSILKSSLRPLETSARSQKVMVRARPIVRVRAKPITPSSSLRVLGSTLLELPPALQHQPSERPTALRQLQYQLDLLHLRAQ